MAFIPVPESARVTLTFENDNNNQAVNVLWFKDLEGDLTSTRAAVLTSVMADWLSNQWDTAANENWQAVSAEALAGHVQNGPYDIQPLSIPGTLTGEPLPSEVSIAISLRTGLSGRSYRGRVFHVGVGEDNSAGDYISSAYRTGLINAYAALISMANAFDFQWSVCSMYTNGAPRAAGLLTAITQVTIVDTILDSQRRRKPKF